MSASLTQHVQERTHKHGHILDLVTTWDVGNLVKGVSDSADHSVLFSRLKVMFGLSGNVLD